MGLDVWGNLYVGFVPKVGAVLESKTFDAFAKALAKDEKTPDATSDDVREWMEGPDDSSQLGYHVLSTGPFFGFAIAGTGSHKRGEVAREIDLKDIIAGKKRMEKYAKLLGVKTPVTIILSLDMST
jgi:hypothetical protein